MDTSKEYIKMCEKAVEIQEQSPFSPFDEIDCDTDQYGSFYRLQGDRIEILHWDNDEGGDIVGGYKETYLGLFWLPRQDQLQEMVDLELAKKIEAFYFFCLGVSRFDERYMELISLDGDAERLNNKSMEQLWLAFVMKEKFNKTWNGEDWKATPRKS